MAYQNFFFFFSMPTKYKRIGSCSRASWTEQQLIAAIDAVNDNRMGVNDAARNFGIPATTLRRRKLKHNLKKGPLGPSSILGEATEAKLARHILKLQKNGFAPTRTDLRSMAFKLAEQLGIKHRFNKESRLAGFPWLKLFLQRNPRLSVRKAEGVSINRSLGMNKKDVAEYFQLLENILTENDLMNKPGHIYNMDETGLQLNNRPGHVIVQKGSKNIASISSGEKGETITVITCCNAEGVFIPPTCVMKGKNKKHEFEDGMPPGSMVYMSEKSAYVNSDIFFQWLKDQFVPRKPTGAVLLLLDGHASHCSNIEMLEYCVNHNIILFCLPSHTTQFLQPLDRCFFRSFKLNYYSACNLYIKNNPGRKITRLQFGKLLAEGWNKSATVNNATSAFKATGIVPFNPYAIPDDAYLTENSIIPEVLDAVENKRNPYGNSQTLNKAVSNDNQQPSCSWQIVAETVPGEQNEPPAIINANTPDDNQQPCCSWQTVGESIPEDENEPPAETNASTPEKCTPGKILDIISPVPVVSAAINSVRTRSKQLAEILTSETTIAEKKKKATKKTHKEKKTSKLEPVFKKSKVTKTKTKKASKHDSSSDEDLESPTLDDSSDDMDDADESCTGCGESYSQTTKSDDWINCLRCSKWFHESCSKFVNFCHDCGVVVCKTK